MNRFKCSRTAIMEQQFEMFPGGTPEDEQMRWLEAYLKEAQRWMTAAELLLLVGRETNDDGKRWLRGLANASAWVLSGQKGYKHLSHATAEEVARFCDWMESQARRMTSRAERMRRNAHAVFG